MASTHDIAQTKVLNKSGGKNLLRFASSRKRDAEASADVYRNYKRQSVLREAAVHHQRDDTSFHEELDLCLDRNASEVFHHFYRAIWPYVRSLPEVLHHKEKVVELLCASLLKEEEEVAVRVEEEEDEDEEDEDEVMNIEEGDGNKGDVKAKPKTLVPHHATLDILHLVAVLARQLRHELDTCVHTELIPRILLILQPNASTATTPTDVSFVEAAFRTVAYLLQYTTVELDALRPYYGSTIANSRQVVRRLAAETFAPLIRQQSSSIAMAHVKQVLKVVAKQTANTTSKNTTAHAFDGVALLCCHVAQSKKHQTPVVDLVVHMAQRYPTLRASVAPTVIQSLDTVTVWSHLLKPEPLRQNKKKSQRDPVLLLELIEPQLRTSRWWTQQDTILDPLVAVLQAAMATHTTTTSNEHPIAVNICLTLCENLHAQRSHIRQIVTHVLEPHWATVASTVLANVQPSDRTHILVPTLVASLLRFASSSSTLCLEICHGVARLGAKDDDVVHIDHLLQLPNNADDEDGETMKLVSPEQQKQLVTSLLGNCDWKTASQNLADTIATLQGLVVAAAAGTCVTTRSRVQKTLFEFIVEKKVVDSDNVDDRLVLTTALECWTRLQLVVKTSSSNLRQVQKLAVKLLLLAPTSISVIKSVATLVQQNNNGAWATVSEDDPDAILEALIPNLHSECHWLRLRSLQILSALPKRPFVVDHAEIDWTDDLDEEVDASGPLDDDTNPRRGPKGLCPLINTLLDIESTTPNLPNERSLTRWITSVANMARTGRLPVIYAEAAAHHLLGTLFLKYSPLWSASVDALVALLHAHYDTVAECVQEHLADMMAVVPYRTEEAGDDSDNNSTQDGSPWETCHTKMLSWELSQGQNAGLFAVRIAASQESGTVSPFHSTDNLSVCDSLWRVVQGAPILATRRSEKLVPIFLRFMCYQYFALNPHDLDARELVLNQHVEMFENGSDDSRTLDSRAVFRRLGCSLRAFAAISRPKGLYKEEVLLSIFTALCSHQDPLIARTAFTCVSRFKVPHISPYSELLSALYEKGKLRDAMMQLKEACENETILVDHRIRLAPLLARILYGRLGSRGTGAKSSKDSPQARRAAVLSFLASFTDDPNELYPFLYLMMRAYLSPTAKPKPLESQQLDDHQLFLTAVSTVTPEHCAGLPVQVNQGFLNVLEAIISQLGRRVADAVPSALGIVISILKAFEISEAIQNQGEDDSEDDDVGASSPNSRSGSIRSLCYRRIGEIFGNCKSTSSLQRYHEAFWYATKRSFRLLPQMAASATRVPALLGLMKTLSQLEGTAHILTQNESCIPNVLKCLSPQCKPAVIDAVLVIIDGLLRVEQSTGNPIIEPHLALMLEQFRSRLESKARESTWRLELDILCRSSKLLSTASSDSITSIIESLCLQLVPYLDPVGFGGDKEKEQVLEILDSLVDKISETCANDIYRSLGYFLGIKKGSQGLVSLKIRFGVASIALKMGRSVYPAIDTPAMVTARLCSINKRKVDEIDFDSVLSALASLSSSADDNEDGNSWIGVSSKDGVFDPALSLSVVNCCFHYLFEDDGVVSRAAFKSLRVLVKVSCAEILKNGPLSFEWKRFLEGGVVSVIRGGLSARSEPVRRFFVLLLRDLVICGSNLESDYIHKDLACLVRNDQPDLDFFHTITHVQVHRRARALQRLRKTISAASEDQQCPLTPFSISRILLPLATHSIYETKANIDEAFALEGIATAGALARHLSWSKYSQVLATHLSQFERNTEQEKYLVSLICSLIDAFHFDVGSCEDSNNSVRKSLEKRLIPMIEKMLTKESKGKRSGELLRPAIALALLKLIQKLPKKAFEERLHRLLIVICNVLNGRDSTARETARTTLGKMVVSMDIVYLSDVVRQLAISLSEGFRVHVRTATLHSILLQLSTSYLPPTGDTPLQSQPSFDGAIAGCVDLVQQDLFGVAQERKEAKESHVRFVQEAQGSKAAHALELMAAMVCFRPHGDRTGASISVQTLVSPFLERLKAPSVPSKIMGRVRDCLTRIVAGLLKNPSVQTGDVLAFVGSNMVPFVKQTEIDSVVKAMYDDGSDDDDEVKPLHISGSKSTGVAALTQSTSGSVTTWQPSTLQMSTSVKEATDKKNRDAAEIGKVRDGASAPKLTGSHRNVQSNDERTQRSVNSPVSVRAAMFCLSLLSRKLKNEAKQIPDDLLDPFVPLLATCACCCRDTEVSMLALKCLAWLLRTKLPSLKRCAKALAVKTLDLLVSSGKDEEQRQLAFKLLTLLLNYDQAAVSRSRNGEVVSLPLDSDQMQVLMSYLRESVERGDQFNQAIHLVKSIMARHFVSVELYELVDVFVLQTVRSSRPTLRQQSGSVFVSFLINYPLTPERIEEYLKQVVANLNYEDVDGRLSAIQLTTTLVGKLPQPLLEKHCKLFFFPLTLQLSNDESKECKEAVSGCIGKLFESISVEALQPLYDYTTQWSNSNDALKRTALQLFRIFAESRPEFLKKRLPFLLDMARESLKSENGWDIIYFSLLLVEKMTVKCSRAKIDADASLWQSLLTVAGSHNHPWVQLICCRLLESHLLRMDPCSFANKKDTATSFLCSPGSAQLYQLGQCLCLLLQVKDGDAQEKSQELVTSVTRCLAWTVPAMRANPNLCYASDNTTGDPVRWILRRLSVMAKSKGPTRALVFKAFAALASKCYDCIVNYLEILVEPLHRVELESRNLENPANSFSAEIVQEVIPDEAKLAKDVMFLLEEQCPDEGALFVQALATVQKEASERKEQRKIRHREEAVSDPQRFAQRRIEKQEKERKRRKRRVQEQRQQRTSKRSRGRHH